MLKIIGLLAVCISALWGQLLNSDTVTSTEQSRPALIVVEQKFNDSVITVGDSVQLTIEFSWTEARHPILIEAKEGTQFKNLEVLSMRADQKKVYTQQGYKNITTYTYWLMSQGPGEAGHSATTFQYTHLGESIELVVPEAIIEVLPMHDKTVTLVITILAILIAIFVVTFIFYKRKKAQQRAEAAAMTDFKQELDTVKKRIKKTDSANILKEVERIAVQWLKEKLREHESRTLQELYAQYSGTNTEHETEWKHILMECDHLRFGGGKREEFELMETIRKLYVCLKVKEEN